MARHKSIKRASYDPTKIKNVEDGKAWVPHSLELVASDAWTGQSIHCRRLIDRLEVEHMRHAGLENGRLIVTFLQFHKSGIGKQYISRTIKEAEKLGLLRVKRGAKKSFKETYHSRYRLTYLASVEINSDGQSYYAAPSNEWRRYRRPTSENEVQGYDPEQDKDTIVGRSRIQSYPAETVEAAETLEAPTPYNRIPPYISWPHGDAGSDATSADSLTATTDQPAEQSQSILSTTNLDQPVESIPDQPTDQRAERQRRRSRPEDGRDPQVMDLEDLIALKAKTSTTGQTSPTDKLRADLKAKLATAPKGTQKALARLVGVSPCHLSNFLGSRFSLNHGALARLQEWIDGPDTPPMGAAA